MKLKSILGLAAGILLATEGCDKAAPEPVETRPLVKVGQVRRNVAFADELGVQGTVRTKNSATISARIPGTIDAIFVEEGASVKQGTALFRVDRENLDNAVRAATDDLRLAQAQLEQARVQNEKASLDAARMKRLFASGAVTKDQWERADVAAKTAAAAAEAGQAGVTKAESGLAVARKNLSDSTVTAPFDGVLTHKYKDAGDYVGPGVPVFALDDPSTLEASFALNAAHYGAVIVGRTEILLQETNGVARAARVTYKSPRVDPTTRTFEVRTILPAGTTYAPGMLVDGRVVFARRKGQAVPATAVALRGGKESLFKVVDGKVVRVAVEAGLEQDGWREIRAPRLADTDALIVEGMLLVNEGDEVRVSHDTK